MKKKKLLHDAAIYTQAERLAVNSMAIYGNRIVAIGNNLQHDSDFKSYPRINLKGKTIIPGLVDAHTHLYYYALSLGRVKLYELNSLGKCCDKIREFAKHLKKDEWVVGEGYTPDLFKPRVEPDKFLLDKITGGRPAFIYSKDQHSVWVNSKALELAGYNKQTPEPKGGEIVRLLDGNTSGILREKPAYERIFNLIPAPPENRVNQLYDKVLQQVYRDGVTGVHSVDGPAGFEYFTKRAENEKLGLRINYYAPWQMLPVLHKNRIYFGSGNDFLRIAGIKIFSDGSLGSQTALCFKKYIGSKNNYGIEVLSTAVMLKQIKSASKLGLPCAIHAIGDKAVSNVLDAFELAPKLYFGARHRIEHLQLMRRSDIARVKKLEVTASMQPSHCPSDINMVRKYWGARGANAYIFRTLLDRDVALAFGSDAPIEPLKPLEGIAAAVRRAKPKSRDVFYPEQRISIEEALYCYTVGPAYAVGQEHCRGYLLPGYPADFVVLDEDIVRKTPPSRLYDITVAATVIDGNTVYTQSGMAI